MGDIHYSSAWLQIDCYIIRFDPRFFDQFSSCLIRGQNSNILLLIERTSKSQIHMVPCHQNKSVLYKRGVSKNNGNVYQPAGYENERGGKQAVFYRTMATFSGNEVEKIVFFFTFLMAKSPNFKALYKLFPSLNSRDN